MLVDELRVFHPIPKAGSLLVNTEYKSGLYTASFDAPVYALDAKNERIWLTDSHGKWYAKTDTHTTHVEVVTSEMPDSHGHINATVVLVGGSGDCYDGPIKAVWQRMPDLKAAVSDLLFCLTTLTLLQVPVKPT